MKTLYTALDKMFHPKSIAIVGASGNMKNMGSRSLRLIKDFGYEGKLYAINPKAEACYGVAGYHRIIDIDAPIDFCMIAVPAVHVLDVVDECVAKGVPIVQILTSGFGETGTDGQGMEQKVLEAAAGKTRIVGPNCMGVYSSGGKLTFVSGAEKSVGKVAICSQSGGLSIEMALQAKSRGLLLSKLVSIGNGIDLDPVDFLRYFAQDPETEVIGFYLEGISRGRELMSAIKEVAAQKPVVILKGGRTELGAKSAASHTNSLAGEYDIWQTAITQSGAIMVEDIDEFLAVLTALQRFVPRPKGKGLALAGNGGGATVLATDMLAECGMTLASLEEETKAALSKIQLPPGSLMGHSIDIPANALHKSGGEALGEMVNCLLRDTGVSGFILHFNLLPFISYDDPEKMVEGICTAICMLTGNNKPVYVSLRAVPEPEIEHLRQRILNATRQAQLPCFQSPQEAIRTMAKVYKWNKRSNGKPSGGAIDKPAQPALEEARAIVIEARRKGIKFLPQASAYRLLDLFGISHPAVRLVQNTEDAVRAAIEFGFPVVLKVDSPDIIHKTDAGGVRVGLNNEGEVRVAFKAIYDSVRQYQPEAMINGILVQAMSPKPILEMICGLKRDPVFGKILLVGLGGVWVEAINDVSMRILPVSKDDLSQMWQEISGASLLKGYRGMAKGDTEALESLIQKVATIGEFISGIDEMDLNPVMLMGEGEGVSVVDCRIILE